MWMSFCVALAAAVALPTERLLLIVDDETPNLERQLVHRQLLQNLMQDPAVEVFTDAPWPAGIMRSVALALTADREAAQARRELQALHPQSAAAHAAAASLRYGRAAALGGDIAPLPQALGLQAAAYLYLGQDRAAAGVLSQLLALDPTWQPDATLYNPHMLAQVSQARALAHAVPERSLTVRVEGPGIAIFVDGQLRGFGSQQLQIGAGRRHHLLAVPEAGEPVSQILEAGGSWESSPLEIPLAAFISPPVPHPAGYAHIIAASRLPCGVIDPHAHLLASQSIDTVLVLAYHAGALRLVTFNLGSGRRQTREVPAAITDLWDISRVTNALLAAPPTLIAP